jgi:hypothetical protein
VFPQQPFRIESLPPTTTVPDREIRRRCAPFEINELVLGSDFNIDTWMGPVELRQSGQQPTCRKGR